MARKTTPVTALIAEANRLLALDGDPLGGEQFRWGVIAMIEQTLHATGNYRGFRYLPSELTSDGTALRAGSDVSKRSYFA